MTAGCSAPAIRCRAKRLAGRGQGAGPDGQGGWKPKRTIVYTSWDAEEPRLLGSTEWAEEHADELKQKVVLYINSDGNGRGIFSAGGSQDLSHSSAKVGPDWPIPKPANRGRERPRQMAHGCTDGGRA